MEIYAKLKAIWDRRIFFSVPFLGPFLLFGLCFNFDLADHGGTYTYRNLIAWPVIAITIIALWWKPLLSGRVIWSPTWLGGLVVPAIGFTLLLLINVVGDYEHYHVGHFLFPLILLAFGALILGLAQHSWSDFDKFVWICVTLICFLPQYLAYLLIDQKIASVFVDFNDIARHMTFTRSFAGFGQYNIFGVLKSALLVCCCCGFVFLKISKAQRATLLVLGVVFAADQLILPSKTSLLGLFLALLFIGGHIYGSCRSPLFVERFVKFVSISGLAALLVVLLPTEISGGVSIIDQRGYQFRSSILTRISMWIIGLHGFWEYPLFGNGLGSFLQIYMTKFAAIGNDAGWVFHENTTTPHNFIVHVLAETGLFGFCFIIGPYLIIAKKIIFYDKNRLLIISVLMPIFLHLQLEQPYIGSASHYWLAAFSLIFALSEQSRPNRIFDIKQIHKFLPMAAFGSVILSASAGALVALNLLVSAHQALRIEYYARDFSVDEYLVIRFQQDDLKHPVLGEGNRARAHVTLAQKAIYEKRIDVLREISTPAFELDLVPHYPSVNIWLLMGTIYLETGQIIDAKLFAKYMGMYLPNLQTVYENIVDDDARAVDRIQR